MTLLDVGGRGVESGCWIAAPRGTFQVDPRQSMSQKNQAVDFDMVEHQGQPRVGIAGTDEGTSDWGRFVGARGYRGRRRVDLGVWSIYPSPRIAGWWQVVEWETPDSPTAGWSTVLPWRAAEALWSGIEAHHADLGDEPM